MTVKLKVDLGQESYDIVIEQGALAHLNDYIQSVYHGKKIMIISDDHVFAYYGKKVVEQLQGDYEVGHIVIAHGEQSKRFDILPDIYRQLLSFHLTRSDLIIALGGGVIGDLAGFVASTFLRGIPFIQIPTSLLAQVDSSVGGKVAVDLDEGKNLVGAFFNPLLVIIDPLTLKTLEPRFICDGMGEVIKYGCIFDRSLFSRLQSYASFEALYQDIDDIIYRCVDLKRMVVEKDLYDFGNRLVLNFGHTLGHAIEQYYHYEKYSHGEAVSIGMVMLTQIAEEKGLTKRGVAKQIQEVLSHYQLPYQVNISMNDLKQAMLLDKKNINQQLSYILLHDIGEAYVYPSDIDFVDGVREE